MSAWLAVQLVVAAGLYAVYRYRRWLALLTLLWIIAGVLFQNNANWRDIIAGRILTFGHVPWHAVSRLAVKTEPAPAIVGYQTGTQRLNSESYIDFTQLEHLFIRHNIDLESAYDLGALQEVVRQGLILRPEIWIVLQQSVTSSKAVTGLDEVVQAIGYDMCETIEAGTDTLILQFAWDIRGCTSLEQLLVSQTDQITYQLFGVEYDDAGGKITFADAWKLRGNARAEDYKMSYQLISPDWRNVAQLDLPLVHDDTPRRFSIDVSEAPEGSYRLMAVVYDSRTGDRLTWATNDDYILEMLLLDEIVITSTE